MSLDEMLRTIVREELRRALSDERSGQQLQAQAHDLRPLAVEADAVQVSTKTLRRAIAAGELAAVGRGRLLRVSHADVVAWLARKSTAPAQPADEIAAAMLDRSRKGQR